MRRATPAGRRTGLRTIFLAATAALATGLACPAAAGGPARFEVEEYTVAGTTPRTLVAAMRAHPFPQHRGLALASLRTEQTLRVVTRSEGARCLAEIVEVQLRFVVTLPRAADEAAMSPAVRDAWVRFATFVRTHEDGHRAITLQCVRRFEAVAAGSTSEAGCPALEATLSEQLAIFNAFCVEQHIRFDRRERTRLEALALMRAARKPRGDRLHLRRSVVTE